MSRAYHRFETALGWMGLVWSEAGINRILTPERTAEASEHRLLRLAGPDAQAVRSDALPPRVAAAVELLRRYADGEPVDFSDVDVDLAEIDPFRRAVYAAARRLGFGETTTYGALSEAAGYPGQARDTGQALGQNPVPIVVPCHRILAAGGKIGGFSAPGGPRTKEKLLALEGVQVGPKQASLAL